MFNFVCPKCGRKLKADRGQRGRCPGCGAVVRVGPITPEEEVRATEPILHPLTLASIVMGALLAVEVFLAILYGQQWRATQDRLAEALTPSDRAALRSQIAYIKREISTVRLQNVSLQNHIRAAESTAKELTKAQVALDRQTGELGKQMKDFLAFLAKTGLQPDEVGIRTKIAASALDNAQ